MNILITGGAGFIGSFLAEQYQSKGHEVVIVDNLSTGSLENLEKINFAGSFISGDIRNRELVESLVREADLVLHMAAALGVSTIMNNTLESISTNIIGSEIVLSAASKFKKRILIASTSEIYGKSPNQPFAEEDDRLIGSPQNIRWSYSDAKAIEEAIAQVLFLQENLQVTTVRLFNTVGPRQSSRYGMVLPNFVKNALSGNDLKVHGDGSQTRVFCHVSDVVAAIVGLLETDKSIGQVYNVGGKEEVTIRDLANSIIIKSKSKSRVRLIEYSEVYPVGFEDMRRRVPNIGKIQKEIGWQPQIGLDQIIDDIIRKFDGNL